eukprot:g56758.t1
MTQLVDYEKLELGFTPQGPGGVLHCFFKRFKTIPTIVSKLASDPKFTLKPNVQNSKIPATSDFVTQSQLNSAFSKTRRDQEALAAFCEGEHHVFLALTDSTTDYVAKYEGKLLHFFMEYLGDSGASAVAKGLQVNTTVQTLDIGYNNLGDKGAALIAEAIKVNTSLKEISLSINDIGDAGAIAIANALQVNKTVIKIALAYNQIGHDGAKAIGAALQVNNMLTSLELSSNNMEVNNMLTLSGNNIGDAGEQALLFFFLFFDAAADAVTGPSLGPSEAPIEY